MARELHRKFTVNGNEYAVEAMRADTAYRFGIKIASLLAPALPALVSAAATKGKDKAIEAIQGLNLDPDKLTAASEEARQHLILPDNTLAKTPGAFDRWFNEHPEDMFQANLRAIWELVSDFLPAELRTAISAAASSAGRPSESQSPTEPKPRPSSAASASRV